ncbi:MAG: Uma2 family endonuclease [Planctomycetaceae bacterium]|nr:Uma2 family endonuclease [Planctomycetaceae bacterium]
MIDTAPMTAKQFLELLEDGQRWMELVRGRLVRLSPPDEIHGNAVRNLSLALSKQLRREPGLFACYELGLITAFDPDTVRCPAISCFRVDGGLGELDRLTTERVPELVIEVASSNDRREAMSERIRGYIEWGVPAIWVFDPESQHAHVFLENEVPRMLKENERLIGTPTIPGFAITVGDVFADPKWAQKT